MHYQVENECKELGGHDWRPDETPGFRKCARCFAAEDETTKYMPVTPEGIEFIREAVNDGLLSKNGLTPVSALYAINMLVNRVIPTEKEMERYRAIGIELAPRAQAALCHANDGN